MSFFSVSDKGAQFFFSVIWSLVFPLSLQMSPTEIFFEWSCFWHYLISRDIRYLSYDLWLVLVLKVLLATSSTVWPILCVKILTGSKYSSSAFSCAFLDMVN